MDVLLFLALTAITFLFLEKIFLPLLRNIRLGYALRHIPSPGPTNWLDGHLSAISQRRKDVRRWQEWLKVDSRILRTRLLHITEINLVHPETASVVLKTSEPKDLFFYGFVRGWLGDGLLLSTGKRWARDRRLLTRGFHFDILRGYFPVYKEAAAVMLHQWAEISRQNDGGRANVSKSAKLLTLDILLRCIMSFSSGCQLPPKTGSADDIIKYAQAVQDISRCLIQRNVSPLQFSDILFALSANGRKYHQLVTFAHHVSRRVIRDRRRVMAEMEEGKEDFDSDSYASRKPRYLDFLDILLSVRDEDGKGMSDKEIQEQVDTFLFAGHDTTASALQWTIYYLAKNPHLQEKCRQEIESTLDESREVSYEQLGKLQYLTQFIKESMRLSGTVPYISRSLTQPVTVDGYTLPKGTTVTIRILPIHHNPTVWEDPLKFDPDRFSPEEVAARHPFAFIPFSAGPRNCIGQSLAMEELKSVISLILQRFRLTYDSSDPEPVLTTLLVSRTVDDIKICVDEV